MRCLSTKQLPKANDKVLDGPYSPFREDEENNASEVDPKNWTTG